MKHINEKSWSKILGGEFEKTYFKQLEEFADGEYAAKNIFPPKELIFNAFELTPYSSVKAVILGQDPYHTPGAAMGLCFSVPKTEKIPPSLVNIYKALQNDLGITPPCHGDLTDWAKSGVLLLNTVMTVEEGKANSHKGKGWEKFTDEVIKKLNAADRPIVFMLWGAPAQKKEKLLDNPKHLVLKSVHPSPLSAYRGFLDCKHFSQANVFLEQNGAEPIDWAIKQ